MPRPMLSKSILAIILALPLIGTGSIQPVSPVTVHEWGTFTTVAGSNGESVVWAPLKAASGICSPACLLHCVLSSSTA